MVKQSLMLLVIAVGLGALATLAGWFSFLLFWLSANFLILAGAYLMQAHRVFGKSATGTLPVWSWFAFFPYLLYTSLVWKVMRILSKEQSTNKVEDDLFIGRRLLNGELIDGCANYVDLTAEFQEPSEARRSSAYVSFPILDGGAPDPETLRKTVDSLRPGKTFVHCAQGHGRTGLFAMAYLIKNRAGISIQEGLRILRAARPGIRLNREQLRCLEDYDRLIAKTGELPC